jgi:2-polyprenyl-3-methyl-5-hydroxy-6-metoxy-1,4-benzoquinol methylase
MKTHFEHLLDIVPDLASRKILDLGSGKGSFLIDCSRNGAQAEGLELNKHYIETSLTRAKEAGVSIKVTQGVGEKLNLSSDNFNFINVCEVIEHVNDPAKVIEY